MVGCQRLIVVWVAGHGGNGSTVHDTLDLAHEGGQTFVISDLPS